MKLWKALRSVLKLGWLIVRQLGLIVGALLRGRPSAAAEYTRFLWHILLEDVIRAIGLVQRLIPLWRKPNAEIDRILVVKLDRIGDMVNTTPVFDALARHYPRARVDLVAHPAALALLEGDDRITERIPYRSWLYHPLALWPTGPRTWWLVLRLMARRYPLVLFLRGSLSFTPLALASRFAAAKFEHGEPVIRRYLRPLEDLVGPIPEARPRLVISPAAAETARQLVAAHNGRSGPHIVIHASAGAPTKVWPVERYAALADGLVVRHAALIHFLGGPADGPLLEAIASRATQKHIYESTLTLAQSVALVATSDLFIGNDSGPSHIAAAVGTPLVVLWGSANLSVDHPAAPPDQCQVIYHELPCRVGCPVLWCSNPRRMECLMRIDTEQVLETVAQHPALRERLAAARIR